SFKKFFLSFLSFSSLVSCNTSNIAPCFECYIGSMYLSQAKMDYSRIAQIEIIDNVTTEEGQEREVYKANEYVVDFEERNSFFSNDLFTFPDSEVIKNKNKDTDITLVYFFVQIPAGYEAYKRDNVQGYITDSDKQVLLTNNFYYYANRQDIFYCDIDLKKNSEIQSPYVFSFYFEMDYTLNLELSSTTTRVLYKLHDA
ncbi:MAG: hypothetical protein K5762_00540, partial [Bacilli bacterium]|nr:hypothetical protein [Bacilli bacterium]